MSRPLARRLTVLAALGGCLAAAAVPALAQTAVSDPNQAFPVTVTAAAGTRNFSVTQLDGTSPIRSFDFGAGGQQEFLVTVLDDAVPLVGNDYSVTAKMSNLYLQDDPTVGATNYAYKVPSSAISLGYRPNPLGATGLSLPVLPKVGLGGSLSCDLLQGVLTGDLLDACLLIGAGLPVSTTTLAPDPVELTDAVLASIDKASLPLGLTGGQEGGRFLNPAKADDGDTQVTGSDATTKRIMTGTNRLLGDTLTSTLGLVDTALAQQLGLAPGTADTLLTVPELLTALSGQGGLVASAAAELELAYAVAPDSVVTVLEGVTGDLLPIDLSQSLATMSGRYTAIPTLAADPVAMKPGVYEGTLYVDYFPQ